MAFQPSERLRSRNYIGLIVAQFLAAFNDQAIHFAAIFYASDMVHHYARLPGFHENTIIALVPGAFLLPFLFSPLAGMLADKYSKRSILVFWKLAEVGIMALAVAAFLLPHAAAWGWADPKVLAVCSAALLVFCVFLMGTHSAFFIPAKYGIMPEILEHTVLSQGNGNLEATSFVANVLGTAFGIFMYSMLMSSVDQGVLIPGREWVLGVILLGLAVVGAAASFMIERVPAADPRLPLTWMPWPPPEHNVVMFLVYPLLYAGSIVIWMIRRLVQNIGVLLRSQPLALAVVGIAFFTFIVFFARQTLTLDGVIHKNIDHARQELRDCDAAARQLAVHDGEEPGQDLSTLLHPTAKPKQAAELRVALLIALVSLGIGMGSPLAGFLSGRKIELGLVPIGTLFMIVFTVVLALVSRSFWGTVVCLVLLGVAAGFYIVPLYTLLQHRAPKDSKGNLVATSNLINVIGGGVAVFVFYLVTFVLERLSGPIPLEPTLPDPPDIPRYASELRAYIDTLSIKGPQFSTFLFLTASLLTAVIMFVLGQRLPDFFTRTLLWLRSLRRYRLHVIGLNNLPSDGPVILATNCETPERCMQVLTATDRFIRFILPETPPVHHLGPVLGYLTRRTHLALLKPGKVTGAELDRTLADAVAVLERGEMIGLPANGRSTLFDVDAFLGRLRAKFPGAQVMPVYCGAPNGNGANGHAGRHDVWVLLGRTLLVEATAAEIRQRVHALEAWLRLLQSKSPGTDPPTAMIPEV
jgi:acyl-[acyl-carrier-protein]-phospholipid O-acyltransferase/long-chain-fatty-acid--[acyl-carrier-protein] ligase